MSDRALLVFSHLRWNFVYQRPQHLLSRLARNYRILFLEEPQQSSHGPRIEIEIVANGVTVCRPQVRGSAVGFHDDHLPELQSLVHELLHEQEVSDFAAWFYTPMALPLIDTLHPQAVVYDCMDELSAFLNAPKQLVQRENALLKRADLVFTGGPSLHRSKRHRHHSVHCFPSSVDAAHFRNARSVAKVTGADARPLLGFFGVLDERIDFELLAHVADARPQWDFQIVGPVVKISPDRLPRRGNIEYLGQRAYAELPDVLARWDVCLMPFALNDATKFISPTKTLEYLAAGKPVVSTPVTDVVECFGDVVRIAPTRDAFVEACEASLNESMADIAQRHDTTNTQLARTSWDATAASMQSLIDASWGQRPPAAKAVPETTLPVRAVRQRTVETVVIGAGPTGLSAAYHLGENSLLLESGSTVGGWCRSIVDNGFTFDCAGHIMFSNDPYVHKLYDKLLGDNVHWQNREAWIYSQGVYTRYPFQGALHGLPPDVLKECIVGAIEARFGSLRDKPGAPAAVQPVTQRTARLPAVDSDPKAASITDCCADGIAEATAPLVPIEKALRSHRAEPQNFEEFIYKVWGAGVAKYFAIPYNRKLWTVPLDEIETSWLGGRVPLPDLEEMIDGALRPVPKPVGPNARFGYPLRGGFQALMDGFLPLLRGELELNSRVTEVHPSKHQLVLADGRRFVYEQLISTMPLPRLVRMTGYEAPRAVRQASEKLRHVSVRCVNLGVARTDVTDKHWVYYPEDTVFHRIFMQGNASPYCNAPGGFGLTCEITYSPTKPLPCSGDELIDLCIADCIRTGLLRPDDKIVARNEVDMPYAYVVYDHDRLQNFRVIDDWCKRHDIILAGRYSEWQYYNSDHAFLAGRKAAAQARDGLAAAQLAGSQETAS
jgi:UDP-galactopyranose mutase